MYEFPSTIVMVLIGVVAIGLFLFFWWAVKDLSIGMKIAARALLAVVLILPLALVWYGSRLDEFQSVESSRPAEVAKNGAGSEDSIETDDAESRPRMAAPKRKTRARARRGPAGANGGGASHDAPLERMEAAKPPSAPVETEAMSESMAAPDASSAPRAPASGEVATTAAPAAVEPEPDWTVVPVFYGTDRKQKAVGEGVQRVNYDWERGRRLELGQATVTIPKQHVIPKVERPWALTIPYFDVTIYEEAEDPAKHFTMKDVKALTRDEFLALVQEKIAGSTRYKDHALIFIHGYKNHFDNAIFRTAQIAYDLNFDSAPFLYSWPSGGTYQGYTYDRESAAQAEPYLREFLELVVNETGAKKVSIIAHSMGNQLLLRVLQDLKRSKPDEVVISQLILAAPDVDRDSFENIMTSIKGVAEGITLYTAANDTALQISRTVNGGVARAGDVPENGPIVVDGVDTIDATATSLDSVGVNHSGYAENNALLTDVGLLIRTGQRPPDARVGAIERVSTPKGDYWRYRNARAVAPAAGPAAAPMPADMPTPAPAPAPANP